MSKWKQFFSYFIFIVLILILLYLGIRYEVTLRFQASKIYNPMYYYIFTSLFSILFGIALALPRLFYGLKKTGNWSLDWIKLLAIGTPTLLLNLSLILIAYTPVGKIKYFMTYNPFIEMMMTDESMISLCGTIFGYILISSFNKTEEIN
ncbi:hypothetical protein [Desulfitobacterium metallireducens]|uniref:Uncharacterized protein n=1 Tax=Desulfitobacterium metallireducens DSM 15288 TaxID=871968 RepID=W0EC02_9FIRM|nr:hypothetical protein [Desulfitobacterium metallireducens]AHF08400.1 hypothetical protein DESME_01980 [Desulfitobacterium metallireducens DSM 15288]